MPAISEKTYVKLHLLLEAVAKAAYEQGYKDGKHAKPVDHSKVKVSPRNIRRIKLE